MKALMILFMLLAIINNCFAQDSSTTVNFTDIANNKIKIIGELGKPFGTIVTVKGILVDYFSKRGDSGPNLIVQMINDSATQSAIQIPIRSFFGVNDNPIAKLTFGATYKFRVFEEGWYAGTPPRMYERIQSAPQVVRYDTTKDGISAIVPGYLPQSSPFHFQNKLLATNWEKIEPISWSPAQFIGREALLQGIAENENDTPVIKQEAWKIKLIGLQKWPDKTIGKPAEVYGMFKQTAKKDTYILETGWAQPSNLADQVGQVVKLRGTAISLNGYWWFSYHGIDMYVEDMNKLPNWSANNHFRTMEITGMLEESELPRIDQISLKKDRYKKLYYILRNASWAPIDGLLLPELQYNQYGIKY